MAKKSAEPKITLEREYTVPLRKDWLKVPSYKRVPKAVKTLKKFIARHMRLYNDDLRNVKIDQTLNNELRFRGIKKPPAKIKVKAVKYDDNIVKVQLAQIPDKLKFKKSREEKKAEQIKKKIKERKVERKAAEESVKKPDETAKVKEEAAREESLKIAEQQAKQLKHLSKDKKVVPHRMALEK